MIARIWRGETTRDHTAEYMSVLRQTGLRDYRAIDGNRGVLVLTRSRDNRTELTIATLWRSLDSIPQFTGEDINRAPPRAGGEPWSSWYTSATCISS